MHAALHQQVNHRVLSRRHHHRHAMMARHWERGTTLDQEDFRGPGPQEPKTVKAVAVVIVLRGLDGEADVVMVVMLRFMRWAL